MTAFSLRIVDANYYMEKPIQELDLCVSQFRQTKIYHVPVIRIFGTTPLGQKSCLHIHQVFPYFFVPLPTGVENTVSFCKQFAMSLDSALQISFGKSISQQRQHVYNINIVRKKPFYGYYEGEKDFLQVYLYNPGHISLASDLLINGSVMNQFFQPFETHIPFILQFFIDYNLHGMNFIHLSSVFYRPPLPRKELTSIIASLSPQCSNLFQSPCIIKSNYDVFNEENIPESFCLGVKKQSTCVLEVDAFESVILNKNTIMENIGTNPGLNELWEDEKQRLRDNNESSIIEINESQEREGFLTNDEMLSIGRLKDIIEERRLQVCEMRSSSEEDSHLNANESDQSLVNILLNMAEEEVLTNTPLSETSLINNGLDHEEDSEHEDEENESILMSQTVKDILNNSDLAFLSNRSWLWSESFVDDQEHQAIEMLNNKQVDKIENDVYKSSREKIDADRTIVNKKFLIPQLDGSSDLCGQESSSEEFQSPLMKRKRKRLNNHKARKKLSSSFYDKTFDCYTGSSSHITESSSICNISEKKTVNSSESNEKAIFKNSKKGIMLEENLFTPKVYPSRARISNVKFASDNLSDVSVFSSKSCNSCSKFSPKIVRKKRSGKLSKSTKNTQEFYKNAEYLQKKYNLKSCQVVLIKTDNEIFPTQTQSSKPKKHKTKMEDKFVSTGTNHFSSKSQRCKSNLIDVKTKFNLKRPISGIHSTVFDVEAYEEACLISESSFESDSSGNWPKLTGVTSLTPSKIINTSIANSSLTYPENDSLNSMQLLNSSLDMKNRGLDPICSTSNSKAITKLKTDNYNKNEECTVTVCSVVLKNIDEDHNSKQAQIEEARSSSPNPEILQDSEAKKKSKIYKSNIEKRIDEISLVSSSKIDFCSPIEFDVTKQSIGYRSTLRKSYIPNKELRIGDSKDSPSLANNIKGKRVSLARQSYKTTQIEIKQCLDNSSQTCHHTSLDFELNKNFLGETYKDKCSDKKTNEDNEKEENFASKSCNLLCTSINENLEELSFKTPNWCNPTKRESQLVIPPSKVNDKYPLVCNSDKTTLKCFLSENCSKLTQCTKASHKALEYPFSSLQSGSAVSFLDINTSNKCHIFTPVKKAPKFQDILSSLTKNNLQEVIYKAPFYSDQKDATDNAIGSLSEQHIPSDRIKVKSLPLYSTKLHIVTLDLLQTRQLLQFQSDIFRSSNDCSATQINTFLTDMLQSSKKVIIAPCIQPPKYSTVLLWLQNKSSKECSTQNLIPRVPTQIKLPFESETGHIETGYTLEQSIHAQMSPDIQKSTHFSAEFRSHSSTPMFSSLLLSPASGKCNVAEVFTPNLEDKSAKKTVGEDEYQRKKSVFKKVNCSDIEGVTPNNTYAFKTTQQNMTDAKAIHFNQSLTIISVELHIQTRRKLKPDPTIDPVVAIFYSMHQELFSINVTGIFVVDSCLKNQGTSSSLLNKAGIVVPSLHCFADELLMLKGFASFIQEHDPEIILGYEVQMLSIGYLIERGAFLNYNMCHAMSRISNNEGYSKNVAKDKEDNWFGQLISMEITGRIILNVWRVMRSEVTLQIYTFENVFYHICHQRVAAYSFSSLSEWWLANGLRWRVIDYYTKRCQGNIKLLEHIDFINRTSELARIFGILFYSVISRGSQYRVESMMLRVAKPMNYIPMSPSPHQRARMSAPECIPLVMEPESRFYVDPIVVLDFQSLYPSIIIAYNYCFSTCLGKVKHFAQSELFSFGASSLNLPFDVLKKLLSDSNIHISPNGVGFVKQNVRKGVLPRMLEEILSTRIMVKSSMKKAKNNKTLYKLLDSRQLGLKLIANVTYGYTAANFSGRMPCIEVADSVVRKGRETLERAIHLVNSTEKWNAKVVYGDTDRGASKEKAFAVSAEMVNAITALNPKPVKLKFEKVYQPCFLITKKRYVGYMYESLEQQVPIFEAKGIETVRRDNCPAVGKVLEKSLRILFETKDLSLVKKYVQRQFVKIMEGNVILRDFIIAKEYRGYGNYKPGACVPALALTKKLLKQDRRAEPRIGERVPYVIIHGSPGLALIQLVRSPMEFTSNNNLRLNEVYYITKQLCPSLGRIFSLVGANVAKWFVDLPRITRVNDREFETEDNKKGMISHYFSSNHCLICSQLTNRKICFDCRNESQRTVVLLNSKCRAIERRYIHFTTLCQHCTNTRLNDSDCISMDCPIFFKLSNISRDLQRTKEIRDVASDF